MEKVNVKMRDMIDYCDVFILCLLNPQYDCGYFYQEGLRQGTQQCTTLAMMGTMTRREGVYQQ